MNLLIASLATFVLIMLTVTSSAASPQDLRQSFMLRYDDANARRDEIKMITDPLKQSLHISNGELIGK